MDKPRITKAFRLFSILNALIAASGLIDFVNFPNDPKNAWIFGYSQARILGAIILVSIIGASIFFGNKYLHPESRSIKTVN